MEILITGNPKEGLAQALQEEFPQAKFISRANGYQLNLEKDRERVAEEVLNFDIFINNSTLSKFHQVLLLDRVFRSAQERKKTLHIVNVGSTVDRGYEPGRVYGYEKKALREMSNQLAQRANYSCGPRVSLISFGDLGNGSSVVSEQRRIPMTVAAKYIRWILDVPAELLVNELCLEPWQMR